MRLIKNTYLTEGISMPDDARERVYLQGTTIQHQKESAASDQKKTANAPAAEDSKLITKAEGQLKSNDEEILEQARLSRSPEEGEDLLKPRE